MGERTLQGWVPDLLTPDSIRDALALAFDYRGDVTITRKDGSVVEGFVFDRNCASASLEDCVVRLMVKDADTRVTIPYSDVAGIEFSGRDAADGRSFELWMKRRNG